MSNVNYDKYLAMLTKTRTLTSESEDNRDTIVGGYRRDGSTPFGGFPPIYLCSMNTEMNIQQGNREYSTHKTTVSIKDIMQKRRDIIPFIAL